MGTKTTGLAERPTTGRTWHARTTSREGPQPGGKSGASTRRSRALTAALNTHEPGLAVLAHERAMGFDKQTGATLFTQEGHAARGRAAAEGVVHTISFTRAQVAQMAGIVMTHNHPSGNSFSPEDIRWAAAHSLAEIRAVTADARYSMRPPRSLGTWGAAWYNARVAPSLARWQEAVHEMHQMAILSGTMRLAQADAHYWDDVWKHVAAETGMIYTSERWTP